VLGYNESSGYLTVDGYNLSYPVTFVRVISKGFLTGSIYPLNASISINGTIYQAVNGQFNISLNPGTYEVKVSAPGYATYATNITVSSSSVSRLPIQSLTKVTTPSSFSFLLIIVIAVIIMAVVVAAAVLTINRRKKS
jgi:subtilase family serine protease